jgi:GNAT superfamily N-acetyltransferase
VPLVFEPLGAQHERRSFTCGVPALDRWFHAQAGQDDRRSVARTFVARDEHGIAGFYTLGMFAVALGELPAAVAKKLPRYPDVPAVLIGRLARAERLRGQGVGELLVADALTRVLAAGRSIATFAVVVDAMDAAAAAFYRSLGFVPFPTRPMRLFLPTATIAAALASSEK